MGEDKKADKKRKRIVPKAPVQMIISREYVGTQTVTEAFIPIISEVSWLIDPHAATYLPGAYAPVA